MESKGRCLPTPPPESPKTNEKETKPSTADSRPHPPLCPPPQVLSPPPTASPASLLPEEPLASTNSSSTSSVSRALLSPPSSRSHVSPPHAHSPDHSPAESSTGSDSAPTSPSSPETRKRKRSLSNTITNIKERLADPDKTDGPERENLEDAAGYLEEYQHLQNLLTVGDYVNHLINLLRTVRRVQKSAQNPRFKTAKALGNVEELGGELEHNETGETASTIRLCVEYIQETDGGAMASLDFPLVKWAILTYRERCRRCHSGLGGPDRPTTTEQFEGMVKRDADKVSDKVLDAAMYQRVIGLFEPARIWMKTATRPQWKRGRNEK
ncbi:hypothetical protein BDV18DRAFT_160454 [Aspergillus unguis]